MAATPISATPNPLAIEKQIIDENTQPLDISTEPLGAGLQAGQAVAQQVQSNEETRKATEFEALLQTGEQGMSAALEDAKAQGVDLTGVPDPKLYLRSTDDMARWYAFLAGKVETHQKKTARVEGFKEISDTDPQKQVAGFGRLVEAGEIKTEEAAEEVREIRTKEKIKKVLDSGQAIVAKGTPEIPEGGVEVDVATFSPARENINDSLANLKLAKLPENIKPAIESAAKKLNMPADILVGLAGRESSFRPKARPIDPKTGKALSSATGLGQVIKGTGKAMLAKAQEKGLIGKDVALKDALVDPEMNMIMTGLLFQENLDARKGDVRKALLDHRLGPGGTNEFLKTGKFTVEGRDETEDVKDWIADVMTVSGLAEQSFAGVAPDDPSDAIINQIEFIDREIERIRTEGAQAGVLSEKDVTTSIDILQERKKGLRDELKAAGKKAGGKKALKAKETAGVLSNLVALARTAGPSGFVAGSFKKIFSKFNFFPEVKVFEDYRMALSTQLAKGIAGESGRLTDQDRIVALRMIPTSSDSDEIFTRKTAIMDILARTMSDESMDETDRKKAVSELIYKSSFQLAGKPTFTEENFRREYKINPNDQMIVSFLLANGAEPTAENIQRVKDNIGGAPARSTGATPAPARTIQTRGEADQIISPARGDVVSPPPAEKPPPAAPLNLGIPEVVPDSIQGR